MRRLAFFRDPLRCGFFSRSFGGLSFQRGCLACSFSCCAFRQCLFCCFFFLALRPLGFVGGGFFSSCFLSRRILLEPLVRERFVRRFLFFSRLQLGRALFFLLAQRQLLFGDFRGFGLFGGSLRREGCSSFNRTLCSGFAFRSHFVPHGLVGNSFVDFRRLGCSSLFGCPCGSDLLRGRLFSDRALGGKVGGVGFGDIAWHGCGDAGTFNIPSVRVGRRFTEDLRLIAESAIGGSTGSSSIERAAATLILRWHQRERRVGGIHRHGTTRSQHVPYC